MQFTSTTQTQQPIETQIKKIYRYEGYYYIPKDRFTQDELEKFQVDLDKTDTSSLNFRNTYKAIALTKEEFTPIPLNRNLVDAYFDSQRKEKMANEYLLNNVNYNPVTNNYLMIQTNSKNTFEIQIITQEPITEEYLVERFDKIQEYFKNDYSENGGKQNKVIIDGKEVEINEVEYKGHLALYNDLKDGKEVIPTKSIVEYLENKRTEKLNVEGLMEGTTYNPLSDTYTLAMNNPNDYGTFPIETKQPITKKYLEERYDKIQQYFNNEFEDSKKDIKNYEEIDIKHYMNNNSYQLPPPNDFYQHLRLKPEVNIDGKKVKLSDEEFNIHLNAYREEKPDISISINYHNLRGIENKYADAPEFETLANKWYDDESHNDLEVWRKLSVVVNLGLVSQGNQTYYSPLLDEKNASHSMKDIKNDALKQSILSFIGNLDGIGIVNLPSSLENIFGGTTPENNFQSLLNDFAKKLELENIEKGTTNQKFTFTGDVTIDENSSEEYKEFITNTLIDFFEYRKNQHITNSSNKPVNEVEKAIVEQVSDEEYVDWVLEEEVVFFNSIIKNLQKEILSELEKQNSSILNQYTKNTKPNPLDIFN